MTLRKEQELIDVARYMPANTGHVVADGKDVWIFKKQTVVMIELEIVIYYDSDKDGYCAQLVSPEIDNTSMNQFAGLLLKDGTLVLGEDPIQSSKTIDLAFGAACVSAEEIGIILFRSIPPPFDSWSNRIYLEEDINK